MLQISRCSRQSKIDKPRRQLFGDALHGRSSVPGRIFGGRGRRKLHGVADKVKKLKIIDFDEFLLSLSQSVIIVPMNFQQWETLVSLSRLRNYHAVADQLGTTQPSVSLRIQRLEQGLGVKLLGRSQNGGAPPP